MRRLVQYLFLPVLASTATLVNHTVDDQYGDSVSGVLPAYTPRHQWAYGPQCSGCSIYPDTHTHTGPSAAGAAVDMTQAFRGSWHDTTDTHTGAPSTVSITFVGQAVYVYNIIANSIPTVTTLTSLVFAFNGTVVGNYTHQPDSSGLLLLYQVPVYVNTSLPHGTHNLTISTSGPENSLLLFDYITYT
ncbi:uncharacterized protein TRAVEDRAFT_108468, partial [Trametes versicolor FP-101664 SS1]|uniref:uncharacterized protein n=1 Tax=Trametes versicolor (strain FP-101664) TaxID=717944 RepID=UPI0004623433